MNYLAAGLSLSPAAGAVAAEAIPPAPAAGSSVLLALEVSTEAMVTFLGLSIVYFAGFHSPTLKDFPNSIHEISTSIKSGMFAGSASTLILFNF